MARRNNQELAFAALSIEGALLAPDFLNKVAHLDATEQSETDYDIPRGLRLRDEIGRYWKIAQNLWQDFSARRERADVDSHAVTVRDFLEPLCRQVLGFADMRAVGQITLDERIFPIGFAAGDGRVPIVLAAHDQGLEKVSTRHGDGVHRRSPFLLAQEYLNANNDCLWALVSNGLRLRILRDNHSLTRPAYIEADLEAIFNEGLYPDFTALWLLAHASRFGKVGAEPVDCALERWRNTAQKDGIRARNRLRVGVTEALRVLGSNFLAHKDNAELRRRIETGELSTQNYFEQLLRLIYRFIFLATIEDRELVFAPDAETEARERYFSGYSLTRLRQLAARRRGYDRHSDLWQVLIITIDGLGRGQPALGLPALGGLFSATQCPDIDAANLENQALLSALFSLCFFRNGVALSRVNYRDMDSEELGSVYESLLELVPQVTLTGGVRKFGFISDEEDGSTKGNARKLTSSYYTPDSLVQELIKSALEPVIARTLADNPQEPVKALLELTVCDPACGSGHFLLAAARRIADEVALLKASEGNPTEDDFRHALRDVVAHCIYGVDKNRMAVELARTALWLEAYTPDLPLTFLDAHLRCGDALLGVLDEGILSQGIPDRAFVGLSGDDEEVAKRLKTANRNAQKAITKAKEKSLHMLSLELGDGVDTFAFEALPDDTLEALETKRHAYAALEASIASSKARLAADIFVAAFLIPKRPETEAGIPTSQDLWLVLNGDNPRPGIADSAHDAAQAAQAFHWWQAFPQVRERGGFSVILGNPPWDQLQFRDQEYFAARAPSIASASTSSERERLIEELKTFNPSLHKDYVLSVRNSESNRFFVQSSGRFPLAGVGRSNTYSLFVESTLKLVKDSGRAGLVVPSGLATDDTTKFLFEELIFSSSLVSFFDFENRKPIFEDIDSRMKFALVTIAGPEEARRSQQTSFVFYAQDISDIYDERRFIVLGGDDFGMLNPNTKTACTFRNAKDSEIVLKVHKSCPVLLKEVSPRINCWGISTRPGLFNMSGHSSLFRGMAELQGAGLRLIGNVFVGDSEKWLPLYEGKMVGLYDHRAADVVISSTAQLRQGQSESISNEGHCDPFRLPLPRHWVRDEAVRVAVGEDWERKWMIGWKEITSPTNERTLIPAVLPLVGIGHKIPIIIFDSKFHHLSGCLLANLSSIVCDYIVRQKLGTTSLTPFTVKQLPILPPEKYNVADIDFIVPRVLELTYTAHDLKPWAEDLGYDGPPFPWNPERRAQLRAELDAYYARLYGLTRDELHYILDPADVMGEDYPSETFRVLKKNEMQDFDEYRTKRLVLDAWGRLHAKESHTSADTAVFSEQGLIRNADEASFAGLIAEVIKQNPNGVSAGDIQMLFGYAMHPNAVSQFIDSVSAARLTELFNSMCRIETGTAVQLIPLVLHRLQTAGVCRVTKRGDTVVYSVSSGAVPADIHCTQEHAELGRLLLALDTQRKAIAQAEQSGIQNADVKRGAA